MVRCTHGFGSGTVGIVVAFTKARVARLAQLSNGEFYSTNRLEVISASR